MKIKAFPELITLNPDGLEELGFVKNFENDFNKAEISLDFEELVLVNEDYDRMMLWLYDQIGGLGRGRFENVAAQVITTNDVGEPINLPHFLDLANFRRDQNKITVGLQARKGTDHFFRDASKLTWKVVWDDGFLTPAMVRDVPYFIIPADLIMAQAVALITFIVLTYQLIRSAFDLVKGGAHSLDVVGTGLFAAIAYWIGVIANLVIMLVLTVQAGIQLKELFWPKFRFNKAVSDYDLINAGCNKLGYTFVSEELFGLQEISTMGRPFAQLGKSILSFYQETVTGYFNDNYPTSEDSVPTLWSLIQTYTDNYNWLIFVHEGVVRLEPEAFFIDAADLTIKGTYTDQEGRETVSTFDEAAVWGRKYLKWQSDSSDIWSTDSSIGTQSEHISVSQNPINPDLVALHGLDQRTLNFAWAGRKDGFTEVELALKLVFDKIDELTTQFGGTSNFGSIVDNREGVMIVERDYFDLTKKLWLKPFTTAEGVVWKQPSDYKERLSADKIYTDYHVDLEVKNNNFRIENMRVPFTDEKFQQLLQNYFVNLKGEGLVKVVNVNWKDRKHAAIFTLKIPDDSAFNVETIKLT